jgi:phage regulator Rha-like protein
MNQLINTNTKSMSSLEISELCKKRHDSVKRTIEILSEKTDKRDAVIACPHSVVIQKEVNNRIYDVEVYVFSGEQGKLDSITIVAQLCPEFTAALVKRWYELENQSLKPQLPDFTNPVEAARAWADEVEAKQIAQKQLEIAAPKVEYFDKVAERSTLLNATQVGQKIGMSAKKMNDILESDFNVYNRSIKCARVFKQWFIDQRLGELKQTETGHSQPMFTTKGEQWVIEKFISEGLV